MDNGSISTLRWSIKDKAEYLNPINIYSKRDMLLEEINTVICERNATEILRTILTVKGMFMDGIYT